MVMLAFIGTFLVAYESKFVLETVLARIAGAFAFGIALFPTSGAGFENSTQLFRSFGTLQTNELGKWSSIDAFTPFCSIAQWLSWVHYGCAAGYSFSCCTIHLSSFQQFSSVNVLVIYRMPRPIWRNSDEIQSII